MKIIFTLIKILLSAVRSIIWNIIVVSGFLGFAIVFPISISLLYAAANERLSFAQCIERVIGAIEVCCTEEPKFYAGMFIGMVYLIFHPNSELVQLINAIKDSINETREKAFAKADWK